MKELIFENRYLIIAVIGVVIYSIAEWNNVKSVVYNVMLRAKDMAKDQILKGGKEQEDWVVNKLISILPLRIKLILNEELIRLIVKNLYNTGLDLLDDGELNNSVETK